MGLFISSTKMSTWRHSLIWFADEWKTQLWQLIVSNPAPEYRRKEGKKARRRREEA